MKLSTINDGCKADHQEKLRFTLKELVALDNKVQRHNHQLLFDDKINAKQFVTRQQKRKLIYERQQLVIKEVLSSNKTN